MRRYAENAHVRWFFCAIALTHLCAAVYAQAPEGAAGSYTDAGRFTGHKGPVQALAVSRDGRYVATVGDDRMCFVIDAKTWKQARRFGPHRAARAR